MVVDVKILVNLVGFLAWVVLYFSAVLWVARHRRARMHSLPTPASSDYRADRDLGLQSLLLLVGVLTLLAVYFLGRVLG
jgi:hypothetical protein